MAVVSISLGGVLSFSNLYRFGGLATHHNQATAVTLTSVSVISIDSVVWLRCLNECVNGAKVVSVISIDSVVWLLGVKAITTYRPVCFSNLYRFGGLATPIKPLMAGSINCFSNLYRFGGLATSEVRKPRALTAVSVISIDSVVWLPVGRFYYLYRYRVSVISIDSVVWLPPAAIAGAVPVYCFSNLYRFGGLATYHL